MIHLYTCRQNILTYKIKVIFLKKESKTIKNIRLGVAFPDLQSNTHRDVCFPQKAGTVVGRQQQGCGNQSKARMGQSTSARFLPRWGVAAAKAEDIHWRQICQGREGPSQARYLFSLSRLHS